MSLSNPNWQFAVGDEVETRKIVAQHRAGQYPGQNVYLIEYSCHPGVPYEIQEQGLRKAIREHAAGLCPSCRRMGKGQGSKTRDRRAEARVVPEAWPSWPVPPSVKNEKRY